MTLKPLRLFTLPVVFLALGLVIAACSDDEEAPQPPPVATTAAATPAATAEPTEAATQAPTAAPTEAAAATPETTPEPTPVATPEPTPEPTPVARSLEGVRGIVDHTNTGWPREVEGLNGVVSIPAKPLRIITASVGHDEMTLAIVPNERLVAVGGATKNETYSNVAHLVQEKADISRDPEVIIAQSPDIVVTSPFFPIEVIEALQRAGIPVIQTELEQSPESRINAILLMGYIYGEEERAWEFADEVQARYDALVSVTSVKDPKPRVLALTQYSDTLWVAGGGATEGGVITAAGGLNAAEDAGVTGNQTTSLEGVIAMAPDIIIIPQPVAFGAEEFRQSLFEHEALAELPAIKNGAVFVVESKHFTTLSYWNILGAEELARMLWPDDFPDAPAESFSLAEEVTP